MFPEVSLYFYKAPFQSIRLLFSLDLDHCVSQMCVGSSYLSSPPGIPTVHMSERLMLLQKSLKLLRFKNLFPFCCSDWMISIILSITVVFFCISLLFIPSSVFYISAIELFTFDWVF